MLRKDKRINRKIAGDCLFITETVNRPAQTGNSKTKAGIMCFEASTTQKKVEENTTMVENDPRKQKNDPRKRDRQGKKIAGGRNHLRVT